MPAGRGDIQCRVSSHPWSQTWETLTAVWRNSECRLPLFVSSVPLCQHTRTRTSTLQWNQEDLVYGVEVVRSHSPAHTAAFCPFVVGAFRAHLRASDVPAQDCAHSRSGGCFFAPRPPPRAPLHPPGASFSCLQHFPAVSQWGRLPCSRESVPSGRLFSTQLGEYSGRHPCASEMREECSRGTCRA